MSLLKVAGTTASSGTLYVNDVFSVYLYTGNGSTQTITNGIDLAGKGGLVWVKTRSAGSLSHSLNDTTRGAGYSLSTNNTLAQSSFYNDELTAFNSTGFTLGADVNQGIMNLNSATYVSWTFRKAAKFFDVVTYTGNGVAGRQIAHSLGTTVGMIIVKTLNTPDQWRCYHSALGATKQIFLNLTNAASNSGLNAWNNTEPTSTDFTVGTDCNSNGATYVAYLYAHDTSSTGVIQCGSYVETTGANAVNLGWEPQYLMVKNASVTGNWWLIDTMRGMDVSGLDALLGANTANAEVSAGGNWYPTATGFANDASPGNGQTYIYMAIRMPNKPPTTGTQVYYSSLGTGGTPGIVSGFPPDLAIGDFITNGGTYPFFPIWTDRLRGDNNSLVSSSTGVEAQHLASCILYQTGFGTNAWTNALNAWLFKRAPGFFDEVCYTGNGSGSGQIINHNLGVTPELIIIKSRSGAYQWHVYVASLGQSTALFLEDTSAAQANGAFTGGTINSTQFQLKVDYLNVNGSGVTYVSYLFATLAEISKVGSYTGNGTTQAIACGFSAGARFVLIKRTDSTGGWYTFDSARGLTSGSSPYLLLNSTAAEVTGNNGVYASTGGFTLDSTASTTTNINGASYIYLSVA